MAVFSSVQIALFVVSGSSGAFRHMGGAEAGREWGSGEMWARDESSDLQMDVEVKSYSVTTRRVMTAYGQHSLEPINGPTHRVRQLELRKEDDEENKHSEV